MTGSAGVSAYPVDMDPPALPNGGGRPKLPPVGTVVEAVVRGRVHTHLVHLAPGVARSEGYGLTLHTDDGCEVRIEDLQAAVRYRPVAPEQWPPLEGDIWRDATGIEWFFYRNMRDSRPQLLARTGDGRFIDTWVRNSGSPNPDDRTIEDAAAWVLENATHPLELRYRVQA